MNTRRDFLKVGAASTAAAHLATSAVGAPSEGAPQPYQSGKADRAYWVQMSTRLASPVLDALSRRRLKAEMPVECNPSSTDRVNYSHLEAFGRLLCGIAPWLELPADGSEETAARKRLAELAREGLDAATDPASPDRMNFFQGGQPLVDAAFLAQSLLRAPGELWHKLAPRVQANVVSALKETRAIQPPESNWQLFATMIEAFLQHAGEPPDEVRLWRGIRKFRAWYLGDGVYGDGAEFHWDYYNAFVIHPMLIESLDVASEQAAEWKSLWQREKDRLTRLAAIQERLIAPDGTYPAIGRSISYRCGALQGLALAALRHALPAEIEPGQARRALTAVIRRTLEAPGSWDANGWLRIGLSGHQPSLGETYISTGSLYLCSVALLPLGLPPSDPFWTGPGAPTTWEKVWSGANVAADHALADSK